jgi:hypothetical protein
MFPRKQLEYNNERQFSVRYMARCYKEDSWRKRIPTRVEAGSNTSPVTLQVVESDKKRSLKSERVKDDHKSQGTQTRGRLRWRGPATYAQDRPVLSSEKAPHKNKTVTVKNK